MGYGLHGYSLASVLFNRSMQYSSCCSCLYVVCLRLNWVTVFFNNISQDSASCPSMSMLLARYSIRPYASCPSMSMLLARYSILPYASCLSMSMLLAWNSILPYEAASPCYCTKQYPFHTTSKHLSVKSSSCCPPQNKASKKHLSNEYYTLYTQVRDP